MQDQGAVRTRLRRDRSKWNRHRSSPHHAGNHSFLPHHEVDRPGLRPPKDLGKR